MMNLSPFSKFLHLNQSPSHVWRRKLRCQHYDDSWNLKLSCVVCLNFSPSRFLRGNEQDHCSRGEQHYSVQKNHPGLNSKVTRCTLSYYCRIGGRREISEVLEVNWQVGDRVVDRDDG